MKRTSTARAVTNKNDGLSALGPKPGAPLGANPLSQLQRDLGNEGMQQLLESGGLQAKLRVSQPGDADEQDADRAAEQIIAAQAPPRLQRKCACGGSCAQCQQDEEPVVHRRATGDPVLRSFPFSIQRQAATSTTAESSHRAAAADADTRRDQAKHPGAHLRTLIVEDDAPSLGAGQLRKREFVSLLQTTTCATADAVLESVGHTSKGCPYIKKWLEYYKEQDAAHLTRAMHKYAPETVRARSAHEAIALLNHRVQGVALTWAKTGKVSDLPEGMHAEDFQDAKEAGGFLEAVKSFAHSGFGSALLGFIGGGKKGGKGKEKDGKESKAGLQRKSRDGTSAGAPDAAAVKEQLGSGQSLEGGVASRMSAAFGYDFSGVRVHTDATAGELSGQLQARAFTIGSDVAFAGGEYKPGTPVGDALIAHELAHVVQQRGGTQSSPPQTKDAALGDESGLEQDADRSAVGAVVSAWTGAKKGLAQVSAYRLPQLKSRLRLQRCKSKKATPNIVIVGHGVAQSTVDLARERVTEILGNMDAANVTALGNVTIELHIVPANQRLTDLAEFSSLRGTRTFDGRLYDDLRGVGGTRTGDTVRYAVAEEQLVNVAGHPTGYSQGFVAGHESGHIVEQFALTADQGTELQRLFDARTRAGGPWLTPGGYTASNRGEYFAQGTAAYFGRPYTTSAADATMYTQDWLRTNDPGLFRLLSQVFP